MTRRTWLLAFGGIALLALAACGKKPAESATPAADAGPPPDEFVNVRTAGAEEVTSDESLAVTGSIFAGTDVNVGAKIGGKVVFVGADDGQSVDRGQTLVELDASGARAQLEQALGALTSARANYNKARLNQNLSQVQSDTAVASAQAQLRAAEAGLRQAIEGEKLSRAQSSTEGANIAQARNNVEVARAKLSQAREALAIGRQEAETNLTSAEQSVRQAEAALRSAQSRQAQARSALSLTESSTATAVETARQGEIAAQQQVAMMEEGTRPQDLATATSRRDQARSQLTWAQSEYDRIKYLFDNGAVSRAQLDMATNSLNAARELVKQSEEQLNLATEGPRRQEVEIARTGLRSATERVREAEKARGEQTAQATENVRLAEAGVASAEADMAKAESALKVAQAAQRQVTIREQDVYAAENGLDAAQSALKLAEAGVGNVEIARQEVRRATTAVDTARAQLAQARAGRVMPDLNRQDIANLAGMVRSAEAAVTSARVNLRDHYITSPLPAGVAEKVVEVGEVIAPGQRLFRLVSDGLVHFRALVPEEKIRFVNTGSEVSVTVDAVPGRTFTGTVLEVLPAADERSRTFTVKVGIENAANVLREGMFARGSIIVERGRTALRVPVEAVVHRDGKDFLVVMVGTNLARPMEVQIGSTKDGLVEILGGDLQAGDQVVIEGATEITSEQQVRVSGAAG